MSFAWIGTDRDQLKVRVLKMKNLPRDLYRAGLYIRSVSSSNNSKCFKLEALYDFWLIVALSSYHSASATEALRVQLYKYGIRLPIVDT